MQIDAIKVLLFFLLVVYLDAIYSIHYIDIYSSVYSFPFWHSLSLSLSHSLSVLRRLLVVRDQSKSYFDRLLC